MATASPSTDPCRRHHEEEVMGTIVTFDAYYQYGDEVGADDGRGLAAAIADLHHVDRMFSTWQRDSPLSRLRRGDESLTEMPSEILDVLEACRIARQLSRGWFDPWRIPGGVDPTGYVKGWATQRALKRFVTPSMLGAIVNGAGDVATHGIPALDQTFRIGVSDPVSPTRLASVVESPGAIATSGSYEQGNHLIDPFSGDAMTRAASATVCGEDLGLCDALATGLCVGGEAAMEHVAALDGYEALLIGFNGDWQWTPSFPFAVDHRPASSEQNSSPSTPALRLRRP